MIYKQLTLKYQKLMLAQWSVVGVEWIKTLFVSLHLTNCNRTCPTTDATIDNTHQNYVHVIYRVPSDLQGIPVIILDEKICSVYFQQNLNFLIAILQGENENISLQFHCTAALSFSLKSWNTSAILFRLYSKDTIFGFKKFSFYLLQRYIPRFLSKKLSSSSCC